MQQMSCSNAAVRRRQCVPTCALLVRQKQRELERLAKKERREARHRDALTAAEATPAVPRSGSGARPPIKPILAIATFDAWQLWLKH